MASRDKRNFRHWLAWHKQLWTVDLVPKIIEGKDLWARSFSDLHAHVLCACTYPHSHTNMNISHTHTHINGPPNVRIYCTYWSWIPFQVTILFLATATLLLSVLHISTCTLKFKNLLKKWPKGNWSPNFQIVSLVAKC